MNDCSQPFDISWNPRGQGGLVSKAIAYLSLAAGTYGNPMSYLMPSLNALRAFEAAARHLSFKKAGHELNVTPGAISQQVKSLEESLGVQLFNRLHNTLVLTESGQAYLPEIRDAFRKISDATDRLLPRGIVEMLTIGIQPSFAVKWLFPRLARFKSSHPEIDVRISTTTEVEDVMDGRVDLVIRHGRGHYAGIRAHRLLPEGRFPVCSPKLLNGPHPLRVPADLVHHTLLHEEFREEWRLWLQEHQIAGVDPSKGKSFTDERLVLQAAIQGEGVALSASPLVERELSSGRLVRPFGPTVGNDLGYYLLCQDGIAECHAVYAFRTWAVAEAAASEAALE